MSRISPVAQLAALLLGLIGCNDGLSGASQDGAAQDLASAGLCHPACAPPLVCSRTGAGCLPAGACGGDADCGAGMMCAVADGGHTGTCVIGSKCGGTKVPAAAVPPNLLLVLDRSCSMTDKVGTTTKWAIAVSAIDMLTTNYKDRIRFGLTMFPDKVSPDCSQSDFPSHAGPGNEAAIQSLLNAALKTTDKNYPAGPCVTPIDSAMQQAATEPSFTDPTRQSYALLLTDGEQSACNAAGGNNGTVQIITDLYQKQKVGTFVVGFGSSVSATWLNAFAKAGGVPDTGATSYYTAEDQVSLETVFQRIASQTVGCVFQLQTTPPDSTQIYVFFDKKTVARDGTHQGGWDYGAAKNQVTFYGAACQSLRAGTVQLVDVVYGCNAPPLG